MTQVSHQLPHEGQSVCIALPITVNGLAKVNRMFEDVAEFVKGLGYKTIESTHGVYSSVVNT